MKKIIWLYIGSIIAIMVLCSVAYFTSFQKGYNDRKDYEYGTKEPTPKSVDVGSDESKISAKCEMITINYEVISNREEKVISPIIPRYVGLTMEELTKLLFQESENPNLSEIEKGFIRAELLSFSAKEIVIKRTYSKDEIPNKYFMILENNFVTIYYSDRKTVFENTGIDANFLPIEEKKELLNGIEIKDEHELFSILESYTS